MAGFSKNSDVLPWTVISYVLSHSAFHPGTNSIPNSLPVTRCSKFPKNTKAHGLPIAVCSSLCPALQSLWEGSDIVHCLARLEVTWCIVGVDMESEKLLLPSFYIMLFEVGKRLVDERLGCLVYK